MYTTMVPISFLPPSIKVPSPTVFLSELAHNSPSIPTLTPRLLREITSLQIPRHAWQLHPQSIQLLTHDNLTAQSTRLSQSERQIQHVVFVIARFFHGVEDCFVFDYDVAG